MRTANKDNLLAQLNQVLQAFAASRPTAVNLFQATNRMKKAARGDSVADIKKSLVNEAKQIHKEETATKKLSQLGAELIKDGFTLLTHCNAGPSATAISWEGRSILLHQGVPGLYWWTCPWIFFRSSVRVALTS